MAKIIPIGKFPKPRPLTALMIKTLRAACKMQRNKETFGQADLDGSFVSLLKRSLISSKTVTQKGHKVVLWYVTERGLEAMYKIDKNIPLI